MIMILRNQCGQRRCGGEKRREDMMSVCATNRQCVNEKKRKGCSTEYYTNRYSRSNSVPFCFVWLQTGNEGDER